METVSLTTHFYEVYNDDGDSSGDDGNNGVHAFLFFPVPSIIQQLLDSSAPQEVTYY